MGTLIGLFTGLSRSVISINQGDPVIIAFLYGILFSIMWATPLLVRELLDIQNREEKKTPNFHFWLTYK